MAAAFTEVAIGVSRNSSLCFGDRLNNYLRLFDKLIEASARNRIAASVYDERGFNKIGC